LSFGADFVFNQQMSFTSGKTLTLQSFDRALAHTSKTCDLSELRFADAYGLVGTACALLSAGAQGALPDLRVPRELSTQQHLDAMGLTKVLQEAGYPFEEVADPIDKPDVLVPLTRIETIHAAEGLSHLLFEQLGLSASAHVIEPLTEGLWELAANALEHSGEHALLMGQVYNDPGERYGGDRVQVVVGDIGKGVRASFTDSGTQSPKTDREAIELALEYLVSSVPDEGRGQGLTSTAEGVTRWGGTLAVRTGSARVDISPKGQRPLSVFPMPGTVVGIELPL
jgi:hypothetical protein